MENVHVVKLHVEIILKIDATSFLFTDKSNNNNNNARTDRSVPNFVYLNF